MEPVNRRILEQVIAESAEPVLVVRVDHSEWPVMLSNGDGQRIPHVQ